MLLQRLGAMLTGQRGNDMTVTVPLRVYFLGHLAALELRHAAAVLMEDSADKGHRCTQMLST